MAKEKIKIAEEVAPNLVPMIDIMFLLLLFFMLSADMGQRELEEVKLPQAMSIKEDKEQTAAEQGAGRLMINVYHRYSSDVTCEVYNKAMKIDDPSRKPVCREDNHWRVGIKGRDYSKIEELEKRLDLEAKPERKDPKNPMVSERKVMIRVDELAPYGLAQRAMNTCAKVGIYKIEVGAARPPDAGNKKTTH